jgi:peroxiredoxin
MRKGFLFILLTIIGFTPLSTSLLQGANPAPPPPDCPSCEAFGIQRFQEKKEAPPFSLKDLAGNQVSLSTLKGKPILMIFFASWCSACKEDVPLIERFSDGKKDQLTILALAIDGEKEKKVQRFVKASKITLPVLLDVKEKIARTYGVRMVSTAFLINGEGSMVGMIVGQRDWSTPTAWSAIKEMLIR